MCLATCFASLKYLIKKAYYDGHTDIMVDIAVFFRNKLLKKRYSVRSSISEL